MQTQPSEPTQPNEPTLATPSQIAALRGILDPSARLYLPTWTFREARQVIESHRVRWLRYPATDKQKLFLADRNQWRDGMSRGEAFDLIAGIKAKERNIPRWEYWDYRASLLSPHNQLLEGQR